VISIFRPFALSGGKAKIGGSNQQDENSQCHKLLHVFTPFFVEPTPLNLARLDPDARVLLKPLFLLTLLPHKFFVSSIHFS